MSNSYDIIILVEGESDQKFFAKLLEAKEVKSGEKGFFVDISGEAGKRAQIVSVEGKCNMTFNQVERYRKDTLIIQDADDDYEKSSEKLEELKRECVKNNIKLEYYLICKKDQQYGMLENILIDYLNEDLMENSKKLAEDLGGIICKEDSWQQIFSDITTNQDLENKKIVKSLATIFTNIIKKTDYNDFFYSEEMVAKLIESSSQCEIIKNEIKQKLEQILDFKKIERQGKPQIEYHLTSDIIL